MANLLEALLSEEGEPGAYIPNAHEQMDEEIENFSVLESIKSMPPEQMDLIQGLVMGTMGGGGAGVPFKELLKKAGVYVRALKLPGKHYQNMQNIEKSVADITKLNKQNVANIEKLKKEEDLIKRTFQKAVEVSKKTPKGGASEVGVKEFIGKPTADKLLYKALSRQDSKNKMMKELLTGSAIGLPALAAMIGKTKGWPAKLAEIFSPDPVDEYPIEGNIPDMKDFFDMLEEAPYNPWSEKSIQRWGQPD